MRRSILALICLLACVAAGQAGPSVSSDTHYQARLNPLGALKAYNDAMLTGRVAELINRSYAVTEQGMQIQKATCQNDASVGRALAAAHKVFNPQAVDQIGHALGDQNNNDIGDAKFTIDGDHANVFPSIGGPPTSMIRDADGQWKLDMEARVDVPPDPTNTQAECDDMAQRSALAEKLADAILARQVKSVDEAAAFIAREEQEQDDANGQPDGVIDLNFSITHR